MTTQLRAICFDFDGTLADTLALCVEAFQAAARIHTGRKWSSAEVHALFGPNERGILATMVPSAPEGAMETFLKEFERLHEACAEPFVGLKEILANLGSKGIRLAVVTGKGPETAAISLDKIGLGDVFERVEAGSAAGNAKHEGLERLLDFWQLPPTAVAHVGDTVMDIQSAQEVGVFSVAAAWAERTDAEVLAAERPDVLCHTVAEFAGWLQART